MVLSTDQSKAALTCPCTWMCQGAVVRDPHWLIIHSCFLGPCSPLTRLPLLLPSSTANLEDAVGFCLKPNQKLFSIRLGSTHD